METTKGEVVADIAIAVMAILSLMVGFNGYGALHQITLVWGGMQIGYLITIYLENAND